MSVYLSKLFEKNMCIHGEGSLLILLLIVGEIKLASTSSKRNRFEDVVGGVSGSW